MAATCEERGKSRKRSATAASREWMIRGATDDDDALAVLIATAPSTVGTLLLATLNVEEMDPEKGIYYGSTTYTEPNPGSDNTEPSVGVIEYADNTSLRNVRFTHSLQTVAKFPSTAIDYKQGILPKKDGTFEGVDVAVPTSEFSYTFKPASPVFTEAYVRGVEAAVGAVNSLDWRSRPAGELRIRGKQFSADSNGKQQLTISFSRVPNVTGETIGTITGISKKGHHFLWVDVEEEEDATANKLVAVPRGVYVERLFPEINFLTVLGF